MSAVGVGVGATVAVGVTVGRAVAVGDGRGVSVTGGMVVGNGPGSRRRIRPSFGAILTLRAGRPLFTAVSPPGREVASTAA